jgi:hypothetical protein
MEAVSTSEASVNLYQTIWLHILEDSYFHTRRRENLKSHQYVCICKILTAKPVIGLKTQKTQYGAHISTTVAEACGKLLQDNITSRCTQEG